MSRRVRIPPRPPLTRHAIVAFPQAAQLGGVDAFRRRNDPLAASLPAHVTLVFPFASTLSALQIAAHVRRIAVRWPVLPVRIEGVDAYDWQWVHLRITRGRESIVELHDRLYRRSLAPFLRSEFDYAPHVTIGRADDAAVCEGMLREARIAFRHPLDAVLRSLSILVLPPDGSLSVEAEVPLGD